MSRMAVPYMRAGQHTLSAMFISTQLPLAHSLIMHCLLSPTTSLANLLLPDAKWIYDYTSTGNTIKIVKGSTKKPGPLGKAKTIKVKGGINYDPTDPGVPDSRKKKDYKAKRISGYLTKKGKKVGY